MVPSAGQLVKSAVKAAPAQEMQPEFSKNYDGKDKEEIISVLDSD